MTSSSSLAEVERKYSERDRRAHERIRNLSPIKLLEFSMACDSQREIEQRAAELGVEVTPWRPLINWRWSIRQQTSYLIMLSLLSQPTLHHAWVVTFQDEDTIELHTVERYTISTPRLYLQEELKWYVSQNSCHPPGLVIRRYRCPAVKTRKNVGLIQHFSPWLIHSQSMDAIVLHTVRWFRNQKNPIVAGHRLPDWDLCRVASTPPNSPRAF